MARGVGGGGRLGGAVGAAGCAAGGACGTFGAFLFGCGGSAGGEEEHAAEGERGAAGEGGGLGVVLVGRHLLSIAGRWGAYRIYAPVLGCSCNAPAALHKPYLGRRHGGRVWRRGALAGAGLGGTLTVV